MVGGRPTRLGDPMSSGSSERGEGANEWRRVKAEGQGRASASATSAAASLAAATTSTTAATSSAATTATTSAAGLSGAGPAHAPLIGPPAAARRAVVGCAVGSVQPHAVHRVNVERHRPAAVAERWAHLCCAAGQWARLRVCVRLRRRAHASVAAEWRGVCRAGAVRRVPPVAAVPQAASGAAHVSVARLPCGPATGTEDGACNRGTGPATGAGNGACHRCGGWGPQQG
eukprot:365850-Chlamydomonas_euryale.AAC.2